MKRIVGRLLFSAFAYCFLCSGQSFAQGNCGWKQGDFETIPQTAWDNRVELGQAYFPLYGATTLIIGSGLTAQFTSAANIAAFLPANGSSTSLTANASNPLTTSAGEFAGQVLALKLNIDLNEANYLAGNETTLFGNIVIHDFAPLPTVNGLTIRQVLMIANTLLGGGTYDFGPATAAQLLSLINGAFINGTPSVFAQQYLKKGWKNGDANTYPQTWWGGSPSAPEAGALNSFMGGVYSSVNGVLVAGNASTGLHTIRLTSPAAITSFLPASGPAAALINSLTDPTSSSSGVFGGEVIALKLNVDFSAARITSNTSTKLGNLVLTNSLSALNGLTVNHVLLIANYLLAGGAADVSISELNPIIHEINNAFYNGVASQFAQDHLTGWTPGTLFTFPQTSWGKGSSATVLNALDDIYPLSFGVLEAGIPGSSGYSILLTTAPAIISYLPASGTPAALAADVNNPNTTVSGLLGGEVVALKLNVDFSDGGVPQSISNIVFGDLVLQGLSTTPLYNGLTVRQFLALAETALGGGSVTGSFTDIASVCQELNASFWGGHPSKWAQLHLKKGWVQGDYLTRSQLKWDENNNWYSDYNDVYANTFGLIEVGIPGVAGYSIRFTAPDPIANYFVAVGIPAPLNTDHLDGTTTSSGQLGGEVLALRLNVDFSDAGKTPNNNGVPFGDLILYNITTIPQLNNLSVRQVLDIANTLLGGGSTTVALDNNFNDIVAYLNASFIYGSPNQWVKEHLISPCDAADQNHCPVATAASAATSVGTAVNIQLQATDEDNDALTYSISQNPAHGTVSTSSAGAAIYTPAAGYYGSDVFKFKANDGNCDGEGTVSITVVMCPKGKGEWKNNPNAWPASATPMILGTKSYTKAQMITLLNTSPGNGGNADASIILAHQLIAAKLSIANGSPSASIAATISHADGLLTTYSGSLPYKVRPNTTAGQAMVADAALLENFNNGLVTQGCYAEPPKARMSLVTGDAEISEPAAELKVFPNPTNNYFTLSLKGKSNEPVTMQVMDVYGRVVETKNIIPNNLTRFGHSYSSGIYFVKIRHGNEQKVFKLVKTGR